MNKSSINPMPEYFDRYINLVPDNQDLITALQKSIMDIYDLDQNKIISLGDQVYEPGKWTIKQLLLHIADTERVFVYRALRFARRDNTPLQGFDEKLFAATSFANDRSLDSIFEELITLRQSTLVFYRNLNEEQLLATGQVMTGPISVLAIGYALIGHQIHHFNIIKERYFPLLEAN